MQGRHMQLIQKGGGQCRHGARSLQIVHRVAGCKEAITDAA